MIAAIEYPVMDRGRLSRECFYIVDSVGEKVLNRREGQTRWIYVPRQSFEEDVSRGSYGEVFADRFLTPYTVIEGGGLIEELFDLYAERAVRQAILDLINEHGLAAANITFLPEFIVMNKVRSRSTVYPPSQGLLWWADERRGNARVLSLVSERFKPVLSRFEREGTFYERDGRYHIPHDVVVSIMEREKRGQSWPIKVDTNVLELFRLGRLPLFNPYFRIANLGSMVRYPQLQVDPTRYLYVRTSLGYQRFKEQERIRGVFPKSLMRAGCTLKVRRKGYLFNSTYEVQILEEKRVVERYFLKRYLSWTDLKWVATKLVTFPIKTFYISPATRMGNELFFISYLTDKGVRVPEIAYVDWNNKIVLEEFIEGRTMTEIWVEDDDSRELREASRTAGERVAFVHSLGVVLGDCKPDNVICNSRGECWLVDLEQASFGDEREWDLAECIYYLGHYVDSDRASEFAVSFVEGYLRLGSIEVVENALNAAYRFALSFWTPPWVLTKVSDAVRGAIRA
ncbi:MAG: hypothetical protein NZ920_01055 [Aigarchaeota archaeon]|nr:hypothetical protein [Aigarchaeota archaeon]MDW8093029.1 hypothetical protein [Nitrososphaerota archaeon]